jgi:predicted dehydrogenase
MAKFRWAYIGNGNIAQSTARSILKGEHSIVAVYGRNIEKAEKFAKKHNAVAFKTFDEAVLCENVDAVYIATPHTSHVDYAVRAMQLGKPVLCEKPVGICCEDVKQLISSSKEYNVYFCEAMWTWFSDVAKTVKQWVTQGEIGDVESVDIYYSFPGVMMPKDSRVLMPQTAGGALLDIGIYPITYCYNLFGIPDKITCNGEVKDGIDVEETIVLEYGKTVCTLITSLKNLKETCVIKGTRGTITVPMFHMASKAILKNGNNKQVIRGKTDYLTEFTHVAQEIIAGKKESDYIPHQATLDCMAIMDECRNQLGLKYPFEKN